MPKLQLWPEETLEMNWIKVSAISSTCMLIYFADLFTSILIKYTSILIYFIQLNTHIGTSQGRKLQLEWISVISTKACQNMARWLQRRKASLISSGPSVSLSALEICLFLSLKYKYAHTNRASDPVVPLWSSNMQPGSWMIKAVAAGLHFETINRPSGAESNS